MTKREAPDLKRIYSYFLYLATLANPQLFLYDAI